MTKPSTTLFDYDVIIIGGGPSGALTAYTALKGGLRVLIIEKKAFPRVKACAGGLTGRALKWLPFSVGEVIEATADEIAVGYKYSKTKILKAPGTLAAFVVREKFDDFLLKKAVAAGADVDISLKLTGITETTHGIEAAFNCGKIYTAKYLVGADGANSTTRKLIGEGAWLHRGYAIEGLVPKSSTTKAFGMQVDFGIIDGGYGWIFPKGDHYNVGLYITSKDYSISRSELDNYVKKRLGSDVITGVVGFSEGFGGNGYKPRHKRILLVGDAAGFAEPFLGEGLHYAIKSGTIAGDILVKGARKNTNQNLNKIYYRRLFGVRMDLWLMKKIAQGYIYPNLAKLGLSIEQSAERQKKPSNKPSRITPFIQGTVMGMSFFEMLIKFPFHRLWKIKETPSIKDFKQRTTTDK